jgi:hypothetical protein
MKTQQDGYDAFDRLADAMVEDIVSTPAEALLAEVVEDCGRVDALSVEFDRIVTPVLHKFYGGPVQTGRGSRAASGTTKDRPSRVSPRRHLRLSERIRGILGHLSSLADPLIFSPGVRLAAVLFFAIIGIGVPAGVYWLSGDQSGAEISGDAAPDKPLGKSRGLGGEARHHADGSVKGSDALSEMEQAGVNYSARLSLRDSKEDVASATRAIKIFSEFRRKYPTQVPGDSKVIPAEPNADIWFRAEFPFTTKEMADRFCDALKMSGQCDVVPVPRPGEGG